MTKTVNLQQIYLREYYLHHQCYEYAEMAPIAATWSKPLIAGGTPVMVTVHGVGPVFLMKMDSFIPRVTQSNHSSLEAGHSPN